MGLVDGWVVGWLAGWVSGFWVYGLMDEMMDS